jgi:hypothetical protein
VAGRRVTASATDRTVDEAADLLSRLPAQARAARAAHHQPRAKTAASDPGVSAQRAPGGAIHT